jgi:hypothetical protein
MGDTITNSTGPYQHSKLNITPISQHYSQVQENEGEHEFTQPSLTNQRTKIGRKVSNVVK